MAPDLIAVRNWARENAADPAITKEWAADFGKLADSCEAIIHRQQGSALQGG